MDTMMKVDFEDEMKNARNVREALLNIIQNLAKEDADVNGDMSVENWRNYATLGALVDDLYRSEVRSIRIEHRIAKLTSEVKELNQKLSRLDDDIKHPLVK